MVVGRALMAVAFHLGRQPPEGVGRGEDGSLPCRARLPFAGAAPHGDRSRPLRSDPLGSGGTDTSPGVARELSALFTGSGGTEAIRWRSDGPIPSLLGSGGTEIELTSRGFVRLPKPCTRGVAWSAGSSTYDPDSSPRAPGSAGPVEAGGQLVAGRDSLSRRGRASAPAGCSPRVREGVVDSLFGLLPNVFWP